MILMLAAGSWLRSRRSRCFFLLFCSPFLVAFICLTFPILCAAEICIRLCRRRRRKKNIEFLVDDTLRRCEEGCCCYDGSGEGEGGGGNEEKEREVGLLQRYLEDQLLLVGSVYDCGDQDCDRGDDEDGEGSGSGGGGDDSSLVCSGVPLLS